MVRTHRSTTSKHSQKVTDAVEDLPACHCWAHIQIYYAENTQKVTDANLTCLLATVGHRDGPASLDSVEEPLLHWVVVQGAVDVNWAHTGEGDALVCQQFLSIKLALQATSDVRYSNLLAWLCQNEVDVVKQMDTGEAFDSVKQKLCSFKLALQLHKVCSYGLLPQHLLGLQQRYNGWTLVMVTPP